MIMSWRNTRSSYRDAFVRAYILILSLLLRQAISCLKHLIKITIKCRYLIANVLIQRYISYLNLFLMNSKMIICKTSTPKAKKTTRITFHLNRLRYSSHAMEAAFSPEQVCNKSQKNVVCCRLRRDS